MNDRKSTFYTKSITPYIVSILFFHIFSYVKYPDTLIDLRRPYGENRSMNKELMLLRHGKSDWNSGTTDFNRPLNKRGKRSAQKMGEWLEQQKLLPDLIISSPAKRALSTAEIVSEAIGLPSSSIKTNRAIYEASVDDLHQVLLQTPDSVQRLLLIGHNPGFEDLLAELAPDIAIAADGKLMPTACLAYLQLDQQWTLLQGDYWTQRVKDLATD